MTDKPEIKTYPMSRVHLDEGWYSRDELASLIEGMDKANKINQQRAGVANDRGTVVNNDDWWFLAQMLGVFAILGIIGAILWPDEW